jgi:hypothetical protein
MYKDTVSTMERPDLMVFSGSKEYRYGLFIDKYQSHNTTVLFYRNNTLLRELRWFAPTMAREVT